ncbi:aminopeptidase P family protein [Acidobacteriota bacterium]
MNSKEKIEALRSLMKKHGVEAYLISGSDPHQNEYVPVFWQRRKFVSGFTGSAGDIVITQNSAGLWTDSRYFLQAEQQLDPEVFMLFKSGLPGIPTIKDWLLTQLKSGDNMGIDPRVITHHTFGEFKAEFDKREIHIQNIPENLVDRIWENRPAPPSEPVQILDKRYTGESVASKLGRLRKIMEKDATDAYIITKLDSIAWLFNIRGSDVRYNPIVISYAVVKKERTVLFIDRSKLGDGPIDILKTDIEIRNYGQFEEELKNLAEGGRRIWLDQNSVSQWIVDSLEKKCDLLFKAEPILMLKAIKNATEIEGMRNAHIRDGAAMVKFLSWLDRRLHKEDITEVSAAVKLTEFRAENDLFQGPSFETISSYAAHGAIVHYAPTPKTDVSLAAEGIYLVDSGGQYRDGTTDITRTLALGEPTEEQKDRFTRILQGVIRLTTVSFPKGTVGKQLDALARTALWDVGENYLHGTGHGIGHYLNVHEGPQSLSHHRCTNVALQPGMIQSIEPAVYKEGEYGMRIENVVLTINNDELSSEGNEFYTFETLTLCPIDIRLIDPSMLSQDEIDWLNRYHKQVNDTISPQLNEEERAWLTIATQPID